MKLILRDRNQDLVDAWKIHFREIKDVEIGCGDIFDVPADSIVSPANSFGWMNGGIDMVYTNYFGVQLQNRLQAYLKEHWEEELPIGCAVAISTLHDGPYKTLIAAPTMRVPMIVDGTPNAFLAMKAALKMALGYGAETVLCPGLGTAVGKMPYDIAAFQMAEAYRVVVLKKRYNFESLEASYRHNLALVRGVGA